MLIFVFIGQEMMPPSRRSVFAGVGLLILVELVNNLPPSSCNRVAIKS